MTRLTRTVFKICIGAPAWKTGDYIPVASKGLGQKYTGGERMDYRRAVKRVKETLKAQGRAFTEEYTGEHLVITAV